MKKLLFTIITLLAWVSPAAATTVTGTVTWVQDWTDCSTLPNARNSCDDTSEARPVPGILVAVVDGSGVAREAFANTNGVYSIVVPGGGTSQMRVSYRDGTVSGSGTYGNARVALATLNAGRPTGAITEGLGSTFTVPASGTISRNIQVNSSSPATARNRMRHYFAAKLQEQLWNVTSGAYDTNVFFPSNGRWRMRYVDQSTSSSAGLSCNGNDCVGHARISYTQTSVFAVWHETGHIMHMIGQLGELDDYHNYQQVRSTPCANSPTMSAQALYEGFADFIWKLTEVPPTSFTEANFLQCSNNCSYSVTGAMPNPPACGAGTIPRSRDEVFNGLVQLVDSQQTGFSCRTETLAINPGTVVSAMSWGWTTNNVGTCSGQSRDGSEEGGLWECSSANWPYTGSRVLNFEDQTNSFLDFLGILKSQFGVNGTQLFNVWANTCWQPGDSAVQLP